MALMGYPLNNKEYTAEYAELFNCPRSSGVFSGEDFPATADGTSKNVTIGDGLAWIKNGKFKGKSIANVGETTLVFDVADTTFDRIDVICIGYDSVQNDFFLNVKKGIARPIPQIPERETSKNRYELFLYSVYRTAGSLYIGQSDISELKSNEDYCGYMQDNVTKGEAGSVTEQNKNETMRFWLGTYAEMVKQIEDKKIRPYTVCVTEDPQPEPGRAVLVAHGVNGPVTNVDPSFFDYFIGKRPNGDTFIFTNKTISSNSILCESRFQREKRTYTVSFFKYRNDWRFTASYTHDDGIDSATELYIYGVSIL